ncbi:MAG: DUF2069 domain-containing protein [Burkholderiaceae bacterium]|jgi:uncharacterized membrane protein|nr:DUF2069 domain-containing protein [Burkholderiaceae bacterium]
MQHSKTAPHPLAAAPLPASVRLTRAAACACLLALIALALAWELWLAPLRSGGSWLALKALPLALPLAGLLKLRLYTYRWSSLLIWLYFLEGVMRLRDAAPTPWLAALQIALSLGLFTACGLHVRLRLARARKHAAPADCAARPENAATHDSA